ncbi:MAG: glycosyltransferase family 2 protein [Treponema sp.]|nr:glycosyltransferase family 2 protein [Treponema sp.]
MSYNIESVDEYLDSYIKKPVRLIRESNMPTPAMNEPILLCAVKNDLERVILQVNYHKKIGVRHFAYIDNNSNDGTFEWLKNQNDITLFSVDEIFSTCRKESWRKQAIDILGYNKWYLIIDSDEYFMYPGIETININKYVDFLEKKKIKSAFAPLIDMYSKNKLFSEYDTKSTMFETYCYFDTNTYELTNHFTMNIVKCGPRTRIFSSANYRERPTLSKYPLTKVTRDMLFGAHKNFPFSNNLQTKGAIAYSLHYKFLPDDIQKYKDYASSGIAANESLGYKTYTRAFEQNPELSFYYEGSQKLNNSMDLLKINITDTLFCKELLTDNTASPVQNGAQEKLI